jgi:hypothetical protein
MKRSSDAIVAGWPKNDAAWGSISGVSSQKLSSRKYA